MKINLFTIYTYQIVVGFHNQKVLGLNPTRSQKRLSSIIAAQFVFRAKTLALKFRKKIQAAYKESPFERIWQHPQLLKFFSNDKP